MTATIPPQAHSRRKFESSVHEGSAWAYGTLKPIFTFLMHILYRYHAEGLENIPSSGPTILVVNHLHIFDPGVVMPLVSRRIVTLAADKWQHHFLFGRMLRWAGVIFVRRGEVDRVALRACLDVLKRGGVLAIAPEGTRSRAGALQRAKPGIAYLATRTNAVLVPIAHWGVERLSDWKRLKRPECRVVIGRPFRLVPTQGKLTTAQLQELADAIMIQHGRLLPPSYRGVYAEQIAALEAGEDLALPLIPA